MVDWCRWVYGFCTCDVRSEKVYTLDILARVLFIKKLVIKKLLKTYIVIINLVL